MARDWSMARRRARRTVRIGLTAAAAALVVTVASVAWIRGEAEEYVYDAASVPEVPVALVLGTQVDPGGSPSAFLAARLEIARQLLGSGKVRAILVSGDHGRWEYDEPGTMRSWLVDHGVPDGKIVLDHAGFDTYDSCSRARRIFGVERAVVVTQTYHLPRAVTLCRRLGIETYGVGDASVRAFAGAWRVSSTREHGACVKAVLDLVSGRDPVFLGPQETGVATALAG
ncbi:ElyC/SanA/YdcF family protein [Actinoplanes sp. NPDC051346]|uniref:SanA/YdcF family protein n=1 Tax=Actinoplanes sp. NPDC051346 TaxID=3155048 RepID=UPI00342414EE